MPLGSECSGYSRPYGPCPDSRLGKAFNFYKTVHLSSAVKAVNQAASPDSSVDPWACDLVTRISVLAVLAELTIYRARLPC